HVVLLELQDLVGVNLQFLVLAVLGLADLRVGFLGPGLGPVIDRLDFAPERVPGLTIGLVALLFPILGGSQLGFLGLQFVLQILDFLGQRIPFLEVSGVKLLGVLVPLEVFLVFLHGGFERGFARLVITAELAV